MCHYKSFIARIIYMAYDLAKLEKGLVAYFWARQI